MRRRLALVVVFAFGLIFALPGSSEAVAPQLTVSLTPATSSSPLGDEVALEATVTLTDARGPVRTAGWAVRFSSSAGWSSAPVLTDAFGIARHRYARDTPGTETIRASVVATGCAQVSSEPTTHAWAQPALVLIPDLSTVFGTPGQTFTLSARLLLGSEPLVGERFTLRAASSDPDIATVNQVVTDDARTGAVAFSWARASDGDDLVEVRVPARGLVVTGTLRWRAPQITLVSESGSDVAIVGLPFTVAARLTQGGAPLAGEPIDFRATEIDDGGGVGRVVAEPNPVPVGTDAIGRDNTDAAGFARFTWTRDEETSELVSALAPNRPAPEARRFVRWGPDPIVITLAPDPSLNVAALGLPFTVTAKLQRNGRPVANEQIDFRAVPFDGGDRQSPNPRARAPVPDGEDATGRATTDGNGEARFSWQRDTFSNDAITATATTSGVHTSTDVLWRPVLIALEPDLGSRSPVQGSEFVMTARVTLFGTPRSGESVTFEAIQERDVSTLLEADGVTDVDGVATFRWRRPLPGVDAVRVRVRTSEASGNLRWQADINRVMGKAPAIRDSILQQRTGLQLRAPTVPELLPPIRVAVSQSPPRIRVGDAVRISARVTTASDPRQPLIGWPVVFRGTAGSGWQSGPVLTDVDGVASIVREVAGTAPDQIVARVAFSACPGVEAEPVTPAGWKPVLELSPTDTQSQVDTTFGLSARLRGPEAADLAALTGRMLRMTVTSSVGQPTVVQERATDAEASAQFAWSRPVVSTDTVVVEETATDVEVARATTTHGWTAGTVTIPDPDPDPDPDPAPDPDPDPDPGPGTDPGDDPDDSSSSAPPDPRKSPSVDPPPDPGTKPPPIDGGVTGAARPGGELTVTGSGCRPGERAVIYLGGTPIGEALADGDGNFNVRGVIPNLPLGQYEVRSSCGTTDTFVVYLTAPEAAGSGAPAAGATTAAVLLFFVLAGNAVLRWVAGDPSGGGGIHLG